MRVPRLSLLIVLVTLLTLVFSACSTTSTGPSGATRMVPDPVNTASSAFCSGSPCSLDDTYAQVNFSQGFTFPFFGTTYTSVWINTNGGVTFGAGDSTAAPAASDIAEPGIGIIWGDMYPGAMGNATLDDEIDYQQFSDHFVITYTNIEDYMDSVSSATIENTATLTLYNDGRVVMSYADQQSSSAQPDGLLIGVFDGTGYNTPSNYTYASSLSTNYTGYSSGHGIIVYNDNGSNGVLTTTPGGLNGTTITFTP